MPIVETDPHSEWVTQAPHFIRISYWKDGAASSKSQANRAELEGGGGYPLVAFKFPAEQYRLEQTCELIRQVVDLGFRAGYKAMQKDFRSLIEARGHLD